jgi:hypothetical protein
LTEQGKISQDNFDKEKGKEKKENQVDNSEKGFDRQETNYSEKKSATSGKTKVSKSEMKD